MRIQPRYASAVPDVFIEQRPPSQELVRVGVQAKQEDHCCRHANCVGRENASVDIEFVKSNDKAIFDAFQAGTEGKAYVYGTNAAPPDMYDLQQDHTGVPTHYMDAAMGMEVWRQLHVEFMHRSVEGGTSLLTKSLSLALAKGFADLREQRHQFECEVRSLESMTRKMFEADMLKIALIKIMPEELEVPRRRACPNEDEGAAQSAREFGMADCTRYDEMRAQKQGAALAITPPEGQEEPTMAPEELQRVTDVNGNEVRIEPGSLNAPVKGTGKGNGGTGKGGQRGQRRWQGRWQRWTKQSRRQRQRQRSSMLLVPRIGTCPKRLLGEDDWKVKKGTGKCPHRITAP